MHTPTKKQWNIVIENLYKILPLTFEAGKYHLDMTQGAVNINHTCNTIHCVGGWYAIAVIDTDTRRVNFMNGANRMARHLGFSDCSEMENWAGIHPYIWGNGDGRMLFCARSAYNNANSISDIIVFLEKVRDRSPD
jgi:hypothetical protein